MNASQFVKSLMQTARTLADMQAEGFALPIDYLGPKQALAQWYRRLPEPDRAMARQAFAYFMEGGVFLTLSVLDGFAQLPEQGCSFELYSVRGDTRERLSNLYLGG